MYGTSFAPVHCDDGLKAVTYFSSFQTAIDAASGGETILALAGTFTERFTVDKALTIESDGDMTDTFIDGNAGGTVVTITSDNVIFDGFTVQNSGAGNVAGIVVTQAEYCDIMNNFVKNNPVGIAVVEDANYNVVNANTLPVSYTHLTLPTN